MKITEKIKKIRSNLLTKTLYSCAFSLMIIIAFAIYNTYLGVRFNDSFAISIAIYYFLLCTIKTASLIVERVLITKPQEKVLLMRKRNYIISSIFIFIIDICMIAPIVLMILSPRDVSFGIIPAIAMAAYSTYKIFVAIKNYLQSKKSKNLTIILLREINIIDALISILSLQRTLIIVKGGFNDNLIRLSFTSSLCIIILIVTFSIISFIKNKKLI